jgi:NADH:ubiquinone oxidoreductase subunit 2 (subunit N)
MSVFSITSPFNCSISLKTPCAAGCCGPKFRFIVLIVFVLIFFELVIGFQFWKILLFRIFLFLASNFYFEKTISLFFLTIFLYSLCLCVFFFLLFFFKRGNFGSLANLRGINNFFFFKFIIVCTLLTLAGIPPFFSFFLKSFFFFLFIKKGFFFLFLFLFFSLLSMYFYLQVARLLVNTSKKNAFMLFLSRSSFSFKLFYILQCMLLFFFFGFFFLTHGWVLLLSLFL